MTDRLLTTGDIAAMLGVPKTWVYEQARKGLIPTVELGRYRRFRREAVEEGIAKQERNGAEGYGPRGRPDDDDLRPPRPPARRRRPSRRTCRRGNFVPDFVPN